jgi:hypothetical protein
MGVVISTGHQCEDRHILEGRFHADLRVYVDCANNLQDLLGAEFDSGYQRAEYARLAFERSRSILNEHLKEHGCW